MTRARPSRLVSWLTLAALLTWAPETPAQDAGIQGLDPLEPGVEDVGPLGRGDRVPRVDMRVPSQFERVYAVPGAAGEEMLARFDGGVMAVFPRSTYIVNQSGLTATVPPGTVFQIGVDPRSLYGEASYGFNAPRPFDTSIADLLRTPPVPPAGVAAGVAGAAPPRRAQRSLGKATEESAPPSQIAPHRSIWIDEAYRQRRVAYLLRRAAHAQDRR